MTTNDIPEIPEYDIIPDPAGMGRGWTAIKVQFDEQGAKEVFLGEFFRSYDEAENAARTWN